MEIEKQTNTWTFYSVFGNVSFWWGILTTGFIVIGALADPSQIDSSLIGGTVALGIAPLVVGYLMKQKAKKEKTLNSKKTLERLVLETISNNNGELSATELSLKGNISYDEANAALEYMVTKGIIYPEVTNEGIVVYVCEEFRKIGS